MIPFDQRTESPRERDFMRALREGRVKPGDLPSACLPFPLKIQIQTQSLCNGACTFCPWTKTSLSLPQGRMDEGLFYGLARQISGRGVERVGLFLMNEPLLDPRLEDFTAVLKKKDPSLQVLVYTNGILLDGKRFENLARAGMDEIDISIPAFEPDAYHRATGGLSFARLLANLEEIRSLLSGTGDSFPRVHLVSLDLPGRRDLAGAFEEKTGFPVLFKPLTNRAGLVNTELFPSAPEKGPGPVPCQRPFVKAYILFNGDVLLCNCDWERTTVAGNLLEDSLERIWKSPLLMEIRKNHILGSHPVDSLCAKCDYPFLVES